MLRILWVYGTLCVQHVGMYGVSSHFPERGGGMGGGWDKKTMEGIHNDDDDDDDDGGTFPFG